MTPYCKSDEVPGNRGGVKGVSSAEEVVGDGEAGGWCLLVSSHQTQGVLSTPMASVPAVSRDGVDRRLS